MMNIGAAIIVKNEENNIEKCLNSIKHFCSQIVVVDTGSSDNTISLVTKYGVDIYFHKWNNDFSEVRNYAVEHCYTNWILYIDADEELVIDEYTIDLLSQKFSDDIGGISVNINNFLDEQLTTSKKHRFTRLFRNDRQFRFTGKIHEQIADAIIENGYKIIDSNITLNHYGYIGKNIDKEQRNKQLLRNMEQTNNSDFVQYHLANTHFSMQELDEALIIYLKIVNSIQLSNEQIEDIKIKTAQIYLIKNEEQKIIEILNFTANNVDNEGLRLSILGATYLQLKNFNEAKKYYSNPAVYQSQLVNPTILENVKKIFNILK